MFYPSLLFHHFFHCFSLQGNVLVDKKVDLINNILIFRYLTSFLPYFHDNSHILNAGQWALSRDLVMNTIQSLSWGAHSISEDK